METITIWLIILGIVSVISLGAFLFFFIKDSQLRMKYKKKPSVLLADGGLLLITLISGVAAILLYLNWQEQLNYFLSK